MLVLVKPQPIPSNSNRPDHSEQKSASRGVPVGTSRFEIGEPFRDSAHIRRAVQIRIYKLFIQMKGLDKLKSQKS